MRCQGNSLDNITIHEHLMPTTLDFKYVSFSRTLNKTETQHCGIEWTSVYMLRHLIFVKQLTFSLTAKLRSLPPLSPQLPFLATHLPPRSLCASPLAPASLSLFRFNPYRSASSMIIRVFTCIAMSNASLICQVYCHAILLHSGQDWALSGFESQKISSPLHGYS
ncbi:hypothetical protein EV426DRAFT_154471 [Tirmania nivea]|nr:hypothetical protein EV426DRAFT_154471 [Tirmania nivea]